MKDLENLQEPWQLQHRDGECVIADANGRLIVNFRDDHLSAREAQAVANSIARLPLLLRTPPY